MLGVSHHHVEHRGVERAGELAAEQVPAHPHHLGVEAFKAG
jgi:hypothetical protein